MAKLWQVCNGLALNYFLLNLISSLKNVLLGKVGLIVYSVSQETILAHSSYIYASLTFFIYSFRFVVIDLSAGPCTYGKIEAEEGSVCSRTLPRLRNVIHPGSLSTSSQQSSNHIFLGQLASLVSTTVEHVIAPDVRY